MEIQSSIVAILAKETSGNIYAGTGFLTGDGIIVTCTHVVNAAREHNGTVRIQFQSYEPVFATVVASSPKSDLDVTILKPESVPQDTLCLPLTFSRVSINHHFKAYGYPELSMEIPRLAGEGKIVDVVPDIKDNDVLQLNSEQVTNGYSGSPVWDKELNAVVGMINRGITVKPGISHHDTSFAIPTETLKKVYEKLELTQHLDQPVISFRAVPPAAPSHFTGREKERAQLAKSLLSGESVAITALHGMGGIGKTALAQKVAEDLLKNRTFSGGVLWWSLGPQPDLFAALSTWAMYFDKHGNFAQLPQDARIGFVRAGLAQLGRLCAIIDDVWDEESAQVLLNVLPSGTAKLLTTRNADLAKALRCRVDDGLSGLPEDKCLELLANLLVGPLEKYKDAVKEIARLTDGLPLALELVAGIADSPADLSYLAKQLANTPHLDLLKLSGEVTREKSIEACFALSYNALTLPLQERFRALSVFPAPFDKDALFAVWGANDDGYLQRLARRNLLKKDENGLLRQHNLLRAYGIALLHHDLDEEKKITQRHANYYLKQAHQADNLYKTGHDNLWEGLRLFDAFWPHLQVAYLRISKDAGESVADRWLSDFPGKIASLLSLRLAPRQRIPIIENALSAARRLNDKRYEYAHLSNLGVAYTDIGETQQAVSFLEQALFIANEMGDGHSIGSTLGNLGNVYIDMGDYDRAIQLYEPFLLISREIGDRRGESNALGSLGIVYDHLGKPYHAINFYQDALKIDREIGNRLGEGICLGNLGIVYAQLDDLDQAIALYEQHLAIAREMKDKQSEANVLGNLGNAYKDLGTHDRAITFYEQQLVITREIADRKGEASALGNLGILYGGIGDFRKAIAFFEKALTIHREIGSKFGEAATYWNMGELLFDQSEFQRAAESMQIFVDFYISIGHPEAQARASRVEGVRKKAAEQGTENS